MNMFARLRLHGVWGVFCLLLLFGSAAWAQMGPVEGKVLDESGKPLQGAVVKFDRQDLKGHYEVKTDKKGHYYHGGLPLGTYNITVWVDGKQRDAVNHFRNKFNEPQDVDFNLKQTADAQAALNKAAETGHLTKEQEKGLSPEQRAQIQDQMKSKQAQIAKNKALNEAYNAGRTALDAKNYDEAVTQLSKASEMDATQQAVWSSLADAYVGQAGTKTGADQQAALDKAVDIYKKLIDLNPSEAAYHNNYGLVLVKEKKIPEAQAELQKAAELSPQDAGKYYYNMGAVLTNINQVDAACAAFKKAIDTDANYAEAQYQYGLCLSAKMAPPDKDGKIVAPPGMVEALQKYLQLKPDGPNAEAAKGLLAAVNETVQTNYQNPNAKKGKNK
jgi:tetratricopeptide (TPR) repeat protein